MKIAYICTNYNNSQYTLAAVESLFQNQLHEIEVFVVDNASVDNELRLLKTFLKIYPSVQIIECPTNIGYFNGLNVGLKALRLKRPDIEWAIVGNNDLDFHPNFCSTLQNNISDLEVHSVISPDVLTLDGQHQNPHVISKISRIREVFYDLYYANYYLGQLIYKLAKLFPRLSKRSDEKKWEVAQSIYQGHGSCYVLGPRFFRQFKEFWAPTFMMSEEFFLSKQLEESGEQVWYEPKLRVVHKWHGALEKLPSRKRWSMARDAHLEYRKYVKVFK